MSCVVHLRLRLPHFKMQLEQGACYFQRLHQTSEGREDVLSFSHEHVQKLVEVVFKLGCLLLMSGSLFSDQNPSEMDALCPSPPGPSRPQRNYERIGGRTGTSYVIQSHQFLMLLMVLVGFYSSISFFSPCPVFARL